MEVQETAIEAVRVLVPDRYEDERGFFSEAYNARTLKEAGLGRTFLQDNHSLSRERGTVRGFHYQAPPYAQDKLVRVVRGAVYDVAVDLRRGSPTYGEHVGVRLSAENWRQVFVPAGFAHGLCTLEPNTEVVYKVTDFYAPEAEGGLHWRDPELGVDWPVEPGEAVVSDRDRDLPPLADLDSPFEYRRG